MCIDICGGKWLDMYNIIYLYIYVIGIGDKSSPTHSNNNTGKVTPVHRKNGQVKTFNLQVLK